MQFTQGNGAVAVKDHLLGLLNSPDDSDTRLENIEIVLTVLENTHGLFGDLNYCYKAVEIAVVARAYLDDMHGHCMHWKRIQRLNTLRDRCFKLEREYYKLQQRRMNPSFNTFVSESNVALAS